MSRGARAHVFGDISEWRSTISLGCLFAGALLGAALFALWLVEPSRGVSGWLTTSDIGWALLAVAGAALFRGSSLVAVGVWVFVAIGMAAFWLMGFGLGAPAALAGVHIALAIGFLTVAIAGGAAHE